MTDIKMNPPFDPKKPMTTREMIEVMEAFERGAAIETQSEYSYNWHRDLRPWWDWATSTYRIAPKPPEPKWIPWDIDTCPIGGVIRRKTNLARNLIVACDWGYLTITHGYAMEYKYTFQNFDHLTPEGVKPCGTQIKE